MGKKLYLQYFLFEIITFSVTRRKKPTLLPNFSIVLSITSTENVERRKNSLFRKEKIKFYDFVDVIAQISMPE